jgi:hypothetical protein
MAMNTAKRRYIYRFWPMIITYVVAVIAVTWLFNNHPPQGPMKVLIAILPALPIVGVLWVTARYLIEETDEFVRLQQMIALLIATGLTLSFCAIWGFLEIYHVVEPIGVFNISWGYFAAMGVGNGIVKLIYR